ncbi:hypothetical protein B0H66DRAFT_245654 [Apodospora peruviana]|uniref:Uncharacterized protein n=1 Tax=Apodospora peruviana TaxID=516989 RepID=A0AAE0M4P6_9PEZI|nr:hypothetical protein B0H66DRAFT_245654 [Apodospora peruviana]
MSSYENTAQGTHASLKRDEDLLVNKNAAGTTGGTTHQPGSTGASIGEKAKGLFAKGHGIGESLRGNATAAVDSFAGDNEAQRRDEELAAKGTRETLTGQFEKKGTANKTL